MKKNLIALGLLCLLASCKKSSNYHPYIPPTPERIKVVVTPTKNTTAVSISMTLSQGGRVLYIGNPKPGIQTYYTDSVAYGAKIYVDYASNVLCDGTGNGEGTINFYLRGKSIYPTTGCLQEHVFTLSAF